MRELITGCQGVVRGAMRAGCDFLAGHSSASADCVVDEAARALSQTPETIVQTEDDAAAVGRCVDAAARGARALAALSGSGLRACGEHIGVAHMDEVPLVVVVSQRLRSTAGGATVSGDWDVAIAGHLTSCGYPIPVLAATDAASAYRLTYEAFNLAGQLRSPVVVLASERILSTRQSVDLDEVELLPLASRPRSAAGGGHEHHHAAEAGDEDGVFGVEQAIIERKLNHLRAKIVDQAERLEYVDAQPDPRADTLIISYGGADASAREAVAHLRTAGERVAHLTIYSLWPIPERALNRALPPRIRRIIVPELNTGLYVDELRRFIHGPRIESIPRYDGGMIHPQAIVHRFAQSPCG